MAAVDLKQILGSTTVVKAISRIKTPMTRFQDFYGLGPGGANEMSIAGKSFTYDIFDKTRAIAKGRGPGSGPATVAPQPVGNVTARAYRAHEKVRLLYERMHVNRGIGGAIGSVDSRGVRYITSQERTLAQRFKNNREFMISRMFRGSGFQIRIDGDDHVPVDSAGSFAVDFKVPAGNIGTVGGIFAGNWAAAPTTAVPHDEILALNGYSEELSGYPIEHAWCNSATWATILKVDQVAQLAGSSNTPFEIYQRTGLTNEEGIGDTGFQAVLRGIPWLVWHIYDAGLNVDGTFTKHLPDNRVLFTPSPSNDWLEMMNGSELIKRDHQAALEEVFGMAAWTTEIIDPASIELKVLDICLPALYIPTAFFYATV